MTVFEQPSVWMPLGAVLVQAIISWWRVGDYGKRIETLERCIGESKEWRAANGQRIADMAADISEIRRKVFNGNVKP